jgi:acyl-CoA synthetase (AMP-forming)/AMP-acid ligase II
VEFNLADLFEHAADAFAGREYLVAGDQRRTYGEMEARANRLAHHLAANGVGPGDHVGIYAHNCVEWVETLWAVFKLRAVWININFRYVDDELRYIFDNADLVALVHQRQFSPRVRAVRDQLPRLKHTLVVEDGSEAPPNPDATPYEEALSASSPERDFGPRSPDDRYILFTGGTTGMPKGVVWRHEDVFYALGGGFDPMSQSNGAATGPSRRSPSLPSCMAPANGPSCAAPSKAARPSWSRSSSPTRCGTSSGRSGSTCS